MLQATVEQAYQLLAQANALNGDLALRSAAERGREMRNAHSSFDECPYQPERSARRRAVWQLSWIAQDNYLAGLSVANPRLHGTSSI